ncbi:MAG TPA: sulfurtransferase TusA family protein [Myxococcota bacterium]|nr:sulfurtransferase TusA family protein [Myxococcota bacterium]HQK51249.1 sulfurtransferase TusA family protein [Myxococcota bacterium]
MTDDLPVLDLRGVKCPANAARALLRLETMEAGERLAILLDPGEPTESVPAALTLEGHRVVATTDCKDHWRLVAEARG